MITYSIQRSWIGGARLSAVRRTRQDADSTASAIWTVPDDNGLVQAVQSQLESWLREKGSWDPPTEKTGYFAGPRGQELLVVHRDGADGHSLRLRLKPVERLSGSFPIKARQ